MVYLLIKAELFKCCNDNDRDSTVVLKWNNRKNERIIYVLRGFSKNFWVLLFFVNWTSARWVERSLHKWMKCANINQMNWKLLSASLPGILRMISSWCTCIGKICGRLSSLFTTWLLSLPSLWFLFVQVLRVVKS